LLAYFNAIIFSARLLLRRFGFFIGAGRGTRTPDLLITNQLLYQLSYAGMARSLAMRA
jgi:hypothetical protein